MAEPRHISNPQMVAMAIGIGFAAPLAAAGVGLLCVWLGFKVAL